MTKKVLSIIAILLIVYGFSIVHRETYAMELAGSICIGLGTTYFIILLLVSSKKSEKKG